MGGMPGKKAACSYGVHGKTKFPLTQIEETFNFCYETLWVQAFYSTSYLDVHVE